MRHYILTASSRGLDYPIEANRRRIAITRGVTARSLRTQNTPFTWLVYVNADDPLLEERLDAFRSAGQPVVPMTGGDPVPYIDWTEPVLTTRIDDDDAFARDALLRITGCAGTLTERTVLMLPVGYRVNGLRQIPVINRKNAWSSLWAPTGDRTHIRMRQHRRTWELAPVRIVDDRPAFLWVRHPDTQTPFRSARDPITARVRQLFDVDWDLIAAVAT